MTEDRFLTDIDVSRSPVLAAFPHGFLGRTGGASSGIYASLNVGLGSQDHPETVRENRTRAVRAVAPSARLVTAHQVHSAEAIIIRDVFEDDARPQVDALVTNMPGLVLGVLTADCGPVLFADLKRGIVGAAHAGWKGAFHGVLAATVGKMVSLGAHHDDIVCAVGPCIARASYEVDDAFRARIEEKMPEAEHFFSHAKRPLHHQFDLEGFIAFQLRAAGIRTVHTLGEDTYSQSERYFSYRRTTHAGEQDYGRQISLIALPDA